LENLVGQFNNTNIQEQLGLFCNRTFDGLDESLLPTTRILTNLIRAVLDFIELIQCERIVPIYQSAVYSGTCVYNMKATMWVLGASLMCSFCGFLMITFRAAYTVTIYTYTANTETNEKDRKNKMIHHDDNDEDDNDLNTTPKKHVRNMFFNKYDTANSVNKSMSADSVIDSVENYEQSYLSRR
jgi:hypothetical protein